ncbi:MAG: glycosyltransferase family 4 protein [Planctomycetaceae bacterium]|nr:glycosyltransferase family 4 protein [Planctomycetaceae bacterium]
MKFGFYSCMTGMPWGGSEELWQRTANILINRKFSVCVNYRQWTKQIAPLERLRERGASIHFREFPNRSLRHWWGGRYEVPADPLVDARKWLLEHRPDYVLITIGYHPDRLPVAQACHELGIPYSINVQCASDHAFINENAMDQFQAWYGNADQVLVVSQENREKLEVNLGLRLKNVAQIDNPSKIEVDSELAWPQSNELKLACVGRIHFQSKGQDLIVRALSQPEWQPRAWRVSFYGSNQGNLRQLEALIANSPTPDRFRIEGYSEVSEIWSQNHALVLASRYEGAALVVVEAMRAGRVVIATDTGRNRELVDHGATGFIAPAATVELVGAALRAAYNVKEQLQVMGSLAKRHIGERYPQSPEKDLAERLIQRASK